VTAPGRIAPGQVRGLRLHAQWTGERFAGISLTSARPIGVMKVLAGKSIDEALRLVPLLFPVCGRAQVIAGVRAVEAARGDAHDGLLDAARDLLVMAEQAGSLAWRVAIDWAPLVGREADPASVALARKAAQDIRFALYGDAPFDVPGVNTLRLDRERLGAAVAILRRQLSALFPEAIDLTDLRELSQILRGLTPAKASIPALVILEAQRLADGLQGSHDGEFFDSFDPVWFGERLSCLEDFAAQPTVDGIPAEVGPLAAIAHPVAMEALCAWGPGMPARFLAAALDLHQLPHRMETVMRRLVAGVPLPRRATLATGIGVGVAATARGPLAHYVVLKGHTVADWRGVAPTEWNFHPNGPFVRAVRRAGHLDNPEHALHVLAASFDPCVPLALEIGRGA
jgi:uptake hydrogenase large subunit